MDCITISELKTISKSSSNIISLAEAKSYLKIDYNDIDDEIIRNIKAAEYLIEKYTGIDLLNTQYKGLLERLPYLIIINRYNVNSIDSIQYYKNNELETIQNTSYIATISDSKSYIDIKNNNYDFDDRLFPFEINFTIGFGTDSTNVPDIFKRAVLSQVAYFNENKGDADYSKCSDQTKAILSQFRTHDSLFQII